MWASVLILVFYAMDLGVYLAKHGEKHEKKYNFWHGLIYTSISLWILYCAGAFDKLLILF